MSHNVIFGTGPLARWVMHRLVEKGSTVSMVNRSGRVDWQLSSGVEIAAGDATDTDTVYQLCKNAETVFHCAMPPYTEWPQKFPALQKGILDGVARSGAKLIFGDNLYMYGDTHGQPLREDLPYAATGHKGKTRAAMAQMLLDAHQAGNVRVAIGRGSDFFGPLVKNALLADMFFEPAFSGKPVNMLGNLDMPHTFTFIEDFATALVTLSENEPALGQVWHVPSPQTVTTRQMITMLEKEIGQPVKIRASGRFMVSVLGLFNPMVRELKEMMYEWEQPYIMDSSKFEQTFGVQATPMEDAITETVAWFKQRFVG